MGHRDGFRDELGPEAASLDRHRADAGRSNLDAWDAWGGARRDALADANPEVHQRDADAEKSAGQEPDDRVTDDARWAVQVG